MTFRLPDDYPTAFAKAIEQKSAQQEVPATFGYIEGTPSRFAGEKMVRDLGLVGDFGVMTNDKKDKGAQGYLRDWTSQWTSGPFGPEPMAPAGTKSEVA